MCFQCSPVMGHRESSARLRGTRAAAWKGREKNKRHNPHSAPRRLEAAAQHACTTRRHPAPPQQAATLAHSREMHGQCTRGPGDRADRRRTVTLILPQEHFVSGARLGAEREILFFFPASTRALRRAHLYASSFHCTHQCSLTQTRLNRHTTGRRPHELSVVECCLRVLRFR